MQVGNIMVPELGLLALILATCLAILQSILPLVGSFTGQVRWMKTGKTLAIGQFFMVLLSFLCLVYALLTNDFSVSYVASNSSTLLQWFLYLVVMKKHLCKKNSE